MHNLTSSVIQNDLKHIWHPCSQMKDYESFPPIVIESASGSYLYCADSTRIIDAISSWWCKALGHNHPKLKRALLQQCERFEHVILANTSNATLVTLSERLAQLTAKLNKVFYAGDGSCAVEVAMKMSLHARKILGQSQRQQFIALANSYHGETLATLSVSDVGIYRDPYQSHLFDTHFIGPLPYVSGNQDPLWHNCEAYWPAIEKQLQVFSNTATALLVEPILQGAGGMRIYSQDLLRRLRTWCNQHDVHLIADEIMTGFGRTGTMLACEHAGIEADFVCLSKGLTSGWMAFSAVLTSDAIYDLFYADYAEGKSFLHSHTYTGNALAASVALETLAIFAEEAVLASIPALQQSMYCAMQRIADTTGKLKLVRGIGGMVAADLICEDTQRRVGYELYQKAVKQGALLRPLGNTLYWLPPLNITPDTLAELEAITQAVILSTDF